MGATAISVRAGTELLRLPRHVPVVAATSGVVEGLSFVLWAFGAWWIPLLVVLGLWRHLVHRWPLSYEPTLWSVVFPIGMFAVATESFGKAVNLSFMQPIATVALWVAVASWVAVAIAMGTQLGRRVSRQAPRLQAEAG
jgi:tellurite resistance protein TehA-like permease